MNALRSRVALSLLVCSLAFVTGCVGSTGGNESGPVQIGTPAANSTYSGSVPEFNGPWASDLTSVYRSTNSELVHEILADGVISDQEYAEIANQFVKCMSGKGFTVVLSTTELTAYTVTNGQGHTHSEIDDADRACGLDFERVGGLLAEMKRNPEHLDENTMIAACLVKAKVVPTTYTANDYAAELQTQKFPFDVTDSKVTECIANPLGENLGVSTG